MADRIQLNPKSNAKLSRRGLIIGGVHRILTDRRGRSRARGPIQSELAGAASGRVVADHPGQPSASDR